jgi:hypothetical protein
MKEGRRKEKLENIYYFHCCWMTTIKVKGGGGRNGREKEAS